MEINSESIAINKQTLVNLFHSLTKPTDKTHKLYYQTSFTIGYLKKGNGKIKAGKSEYEVDTGDILILPINEPYIILKAYEDMEITYISFEPRFMWLYSEFNSDCNFMNIFTWQPDDFCHKLDTSNPKADVIKYIFNTIEDEFKNKLIDYEPMIKIKILNILIILIRDFGYGPVSSVKLKLKEYNMPIIAELIRFLDSHYYQNLTLKQLADFSNLSRNYLPNIFKKLNGLTIWDYILIRRIELAQKLLTDTDKPILTVAAECGFNNTVNFDKAFKKYTAKAPRQFRKDLLKNYK